MRGETGHTFSEPCKSFKLKASKRLKWARDGGDLHRGRAGHRNVDREEAGAWDEKGLLGEEGKAVLVG